MVTPAQPPSLSLLLHPRRQPGLYLALAVYLLLALTYFFLMPIFEGPDEWTHTGHVKYIAEGNGLPVMLPGQGIWGGQQPPLYYALATVLVQPFSLEGVADYEENRRNPHAAIGYALDPGNKNNYLHTPAENFPYRGLALTVHLLRFYSMLWGGLALIFIYFTAYEIYDLRSTIYDFGFTKNLPAPCSLLPSSAAFAASVALFVAAQPMYAFITASVANEPANIAMSAAALWLAQRYALFGPPAGVGRAVALGAALGLAALAKMTGLAVGLVAVLAFLQAALTFRREPHTARRLWRDGLIIGAMFALVAGWWYWRNFQLYGDFFQRGLYKIYFGVDPQPLTLSEFIYTLRTGEVSFWATFGWLNIIAPDWVYTVYRVVSRIGLAGAGIAILMQLWQGRKGAGEQGAGSRGAGEQGSRGARAQGAEAQGAEAQGAEAQGSKGAGAQGAEEQGSKGAGAQGAEEQGSKGAEAQGSKGAGAQDLDETRHSPRATRNSQFAIHYSQFTIFLHLAFPLTLAFSLTRLVATEGGMQGRQLLPALGSMAIVVMWGWWALLPAKIRLPGIGLLLAGLLALAAWLPLSVVSRAYTPPPLLTTSDLPPTLQRLDWTYNGDMKLLGVEIGAESVRPGERVPVTVYWQALRPMETNYSVFVHLIGREAQTVGQFNTYPALGLRPTSTLLPGQIVADTYPVLVEGGSAAPTRLRVNVGLFNFDEPGRPGLPALAPDGAEMPATVGQLKLVPHRWPVIEPAGPPVEFADNIRLLRADLTDCSAPDCTLSLSWTATGTPVADYTVFVQLWRNGQQVAGFDAPPLGGDYPTSLWAAGETIVDPHRLDVTGLPPGRYEVLAGLYTLTDGQRLPASVNGEPLPNFAIPVGEIELTAP